MRALYVVLGFLFVLLASMPLLALEVKLVDQWGNPIKDAYVAVPKGDINSPNQAPAVMDQIDVAFVPHVLAIDQGQSVIFPNSDNIRHHVYSFSDPKKFEIKLYKGVPEQPIYFEEPGLVALGCNIHDSMLGYIYVSPWPEYSVSNESGLVKFAGTPDELAIWHPRLKGSKGVIRKALSVAAGQDIVTVTLKLKQKKKKHKFRKNRRDDYDL